MRGLFMFQFITFNHMCISMICVVSVPHYMNDYQMTEQKKQTCSNITVRDQKNLSHISQEKAIQQALPDWRCHTQNKCGGSYLDLTWFLSSEFWLVTVSNPHLWPICIMSTTSSLSIPPCLSPHTYWVSCSHYRSSTLSPSKLLKSSCRLIHWPLIATLPVLLRLQVWCGQR